MGSATKSENDLTSLALKLVVIFVAVAIVWLASAPTNRPAGTSTTTATASVSSAAARLRCVGMRRSRNDQGFWNATASTIAQAMAARNGASTR